MERLDRIFRLHKIIANRRTPISMRELIDKLECSTATVKRDIRDLREKFDAPIIYDRESNGYRFDTENGEHPCELPGLWFNAEELQGLLICQHLLKNIGAGILQEQIKHLNDRIERLLQQHPESARPDPEAVKILSIGYRMKNETQFLRLATALFKRRRVSIRYRARSHGQLTEREISPQHLVHYRDNWYLDAWCHVSDELRTFSVDAVESSCLLEQNAKNVPKRQLDQYFSPTYGIFSGPALHTATLIFTEKRARWVADEQWHPNQRGEFLPDGRYQLQIPFNQYPELLMDILKYGADVEVVAPDFLVDLVKRQVEAMRDLYQRK